MALNFLNNGYFAGKVGIGTQSPAGLLEINGGTGVATYGGTLIVRQDGDANTDGIALTSSNAISHRIWKDVNGKLNIGPSTLPSALVQDLSGNVGIGTDSPDRELEVEGNGNVYIRVTASTDTDSSAIELKNTQETWTIRNDDTNDDALEFQSDGGTQVTILKAGNVGIGTTSPQRNLTIYQSSGNAVLQLANNTSGVGASDGFLAYTDGVNVGLENKENGYLSLATNASEKMRITSTGNVGIGTTNPGYKLDVSSGSAVGARISTSGFTNLDLVSNRTGGNLGGLRFKQDIDTYQTGEFLGLHGGGFDWKVGNGTGGNPVIKMRLDSSGNLGIGTTAPTQKLQVDGRIRIPYNSSNSYYFGQDNGSIGYGSMHPFDNGGNYTFDTNFASSIGSYKFKYNGTEIFRLRNTGAFAFGSGGNDYGVSGQILKSNGNASPTWIDGSAIPGVPAGSGTLNYLAKWTPDGDTLGIGSVFDNGNVGIGTASPTAKLQVYDDRDITSNPTNKGIRLQESTGDWLLSLGVSSVTNTGFAIRDNVTSTYPFVIRETTGNVGIGTTSPDRKLEVDFTGSVFGARFTRSDATGSSVIEFANSGGVKSIIGYDAGVDGYIIATTSATNFVVKQSGNVGIGTTTPGAKLDVAGDIRLNSIGQELQFSNHSVGAYRDGSNRLMISGYGGIRFQAEAVGGMENQATRMVINPLGNVGIGVTGPVSAIHAYHATTNVIGTFESGDTNSYINIKDSNSGTYGVLLGTTGDNFIVSPNNAEAMRILANGNVGIGTTSPDTKLDIQDSNPFVTIQGSSTSYVNAGVQFISNQASTTRGLGNFYYSAHSDVEWFSGLPYNGNDAFVINRNTSYTVPSSQSSPPGIGASAGTLLKVDSAGSVLFNNYNSTNKIGTPTYLLGTDASGNIVKTLPQGSGTAGPYLPLAGGTMTGDLKLNDAVQLKLGAGDDLRIYHSGTNSNIENNNGTLQIIQNLDDGDIVFKSDNGSGGTTTYFQLDGGNALNRFYKNALFQDNVSAAFGVGFDLQIYHDGSNSYIKDVGTGFLNISSDAALVLSNGAGEPYFIGTSNGSVKLYYDNNKKLETEIVSVGTATTAGGTLIDGWKTTTQANAINDTTIATTAYVNNKIALIPAGLVFQGTWNAATNTPTLTSGSGTTGNFYIVSVAGSTNLDGITDWKVGDWAVFIEQGASDQWEKIDNSSVLDGFGTGQSVTKWNGSGTSNTLTDGPITFSGNDSTFAGDVTGGAGTFTDALTVGTTAGSSISMLRTSANYINATNATGYLVFRTGGYDTALTLDSSQNATFEGNVKIDDGVGRITLASVSGENRIQSTTTGFGAYEKLAFTADDYEFKLGNATFAGTIDSGTITSTGIVKAATTFQATSGDMTFYVNNVGEAMRIQQGTGNVGIGVTGPSAKLSLYDATEDVSINVNTGTGGSYPKKTGISFGATSTSLGGDAEFTGGAGIQAINTVASNNITDLAFWTTTGGSPTERMRIDSAGAIKFNAYDSTNQTGTPTYLLGTDASGNVVKTLTTPSPVTSQAASLYDLIPNGAFTTTYAFTSTAGTYAEVMSGDDVITETGTYSVQMLVNDFAVGGTQYDEKYSGVMTWHKTSTNDANVGAISEIALHRAGHAGNQGITYLRTRETTSADNNELKLEIMCNKTYTSASNVVFKFVRLI